MTATIASEKMTTLVRLVEEATRSTKEGVRNFVPPAQGVLDRVLSKRHHIVFGRRGSGKSSLLEKAAADLTIDRRPIAKVDLEAFKGHSYPDVLLSVLLRTLSEFEIWLRTAAVNPPNKTTFWNHLFGKAPARKAFDKKRALLIADRFLAKHDELTKLLHENDGAKLSLASESSEGRSSKKENSFKLGSDVAGYSHQGANEKSSSQRFQVTEETARSKTDFLHRNILEYQNLFRDVAELSSGDSFLLLDDLYHIRRQDQASVIDYFHRIGKGNNLWLKIGTIRHRTSWYRHGDPPIGLKLGDDADEINLDLTLEKYSLAKDFLLKVLQNFASQANLVLSDFLTDGARDRLVLASGGVARDFLSIFRRSVEVAGERGGGARGEKIGVEDVNVASGAYNGTKREEFKRDTSGDEGELDNAFTHARDFCLENTKTNCFLVDTKSRERSYELLQELVDLKLLHFVRSRVTVGNEKYRGQIFEAYMLDLSEYTGARKRRDFQIIEFWNAESEEKLRRAGIIYQLASE